MNNFFGLSFQVCDKTMLRKPFFDLTPRGKRKRIQFVLEKEKEKRKSEAVRDEHSAIEINDSKIVNNDLEVEAEADSYKPYTLEMANSIDFQLNNNTEKTFCSSLENVNDDPKLKMPFIGLNDNDPDLLEKLLEEPPLSSDESDIDEEIESFSEADRIKDSIKSWANQFHISLVALTALLLILRVHRCFNKLPKDGRTLLGTIPKVPTREVEPGSYCHIGLKFGIERMLRFMKEKINQVALLLNVDGLPLFNSKGGEVWPILGSFWDIPSARSFVFAVGVYYGIKKPVNCEIFLKEFVDEAVDLITNGLIWKGEKISVFIKGFSLDAPAKSFILGIKGHTGYSSCTRCKVEGNYIANRMTFYSKNCQTRTHEDFLRREDEEYQTGKTSLINIPGLHFVNSFCLDYLHLVCLGVMRTILYLWLFACFGLKLPLRITDKINLNIVSVSAYIPCEINRKPRSLEFVRRWKATEFRTFLLYTGPVVLRDALLPEYDSYYFNFLTLHVAMTILLSPKFCTTYKEYADELLHHFVDSCKDLYGEKYITHNFHGVLHISNDVLIFGALDNCSTFRFENFLQFIKKLIRNGQKPLQQIIKRLSELIENDQFYRNSVDLQQPSCPKFLLPHWSGPLLYDCDFRQQYQVIQFNSFKLNTAKMADSCCSLKNGSMVIVLNVAYSNNLGGMAIISRSFSNKKSFYSKPFCESSLFGIFEVSDLSEKEVHLVSDIDKKMVLIPYRSNYVVFPMLHL